MSKTRGEGRGAAEKAGRLVRTPESARAQKLKRQAEEEEWASRSGPVTVRQKEDNSGGSLD